MKFYKYWERAEAPVESDRGRWKLRCYGGSNLSLEDALRRASEIATRAARAIESGASSSQYAYADRVFREEIVEELGSRDEPMAIISRNSYGSLVLNTARAFFADIDYPEPQPRGFWQIVRSLFGGTSRDLPKADGEIITRLHEYAEQRPTVGLRLYRTAGGYRCLATHQEYAPGSREAPSPPRRSGSRSALLETLSRPRLLPRSTHAEVLALRRSASARGFPWRSEAEQLKFREWEARYERVADRYSTCALVGHFGNEDIHPAVFPILEQHDLRTCIDGPLA